MKTLKSFEELECLLTESDISVCFVSSLEKNA